MDVYKRIAYLHQVQDLLNQVNRSKLDTSTYKSSDNSNQSLVKLNSFYGFLAKEISMKHNVQTLNCDPLKQFRCKRCFCQYDFEVLLTRNLLKLKRKHLLITCGQCGFQRKILFRTRHKTKFERLLHETKT